jgi:hypothetical protein
VVLRRIPTPASASQPAPHPPQGPP